MIRNDYIESSDVELEGLQSSFTIDVDDIESESKLWSSSIDIYSNRFRFITEIVSNAYDATVEKAELLGINPEEFIKDNPIIVRVDRDGGGLFVEIEESNGIGISPERVNKVFTKLGKTTKDKSLTQIGSKGIGRMSCLAYTDNFTIVTRHDGLEASYTIYKYTDIKDELGNIKRYTKPRLIEVYSGIRTESSGTLFKCYITKDTYNRDLFDSMYEQLKYFNSVYVDVKIDDWEAQELNKINTDVLHYGKHFVIIENNQSNEMVALLEKVPYNIDWSEVSVSSSTKYYNIALRFNTSDLSVNQSRESILYNKIRYIYDSNGDFVTDINEAIEGNKLKEGYTQVVKDVSEIIEEKIELAKKELTEVYDSYNTAVDSVKDFIEKVKSNNLFTNTRITHFIAKAPTLKGFNVFKNLSNIDIKCLFDVYVHDVYTINTNRIIHKNRLYNEADNFSFIKVKTIDARTKAYLREYYNGYVLINDDTYCSLNSHYDMTNTYGIIYFLLCSYINNEKLRYNTAKKLLVNGKEHVVKIKQMYQKYFDEVLQAKEVEVPADYKIKRKAAVREVDTGEFVYWDVSFDKLNKNVSTAKEINEISSRPILYAKRGEIIMLDNFKDLDKNGKIKLIFLAESYHKYVNGINYNEFMSNPEKFDLGKEIASSYWVNEKYQNLKRLRSFNQHWNNEELSQVINKLMSLRDNSLKYSNLSNYIQKKVKENDLVYYESVKKKFNFIENLIEKNPVLGLIYNTRYLSDYDNSIINETVDYLLKQIQK